MLKVLFSSDFFKEAVFKKVKSPVELVTGVVKLVGTNRFPELGLSKIVRESDAMGQNLLQPLTVEGWHTGPEWIDGGTLNTRVNFASEEVNDPRKPGWYAPSWNGLRRTVAHWGQRSSPTDAWISRGLWRSTTKPGRVWSNTPNLAAISASQLSRNAKRASRGSSGCSSS